MARFDSEWFNELRALTHEKIAQVVPGPQQFKPTIGQIYKAGHLSFGFVQTALS